MRAYQRCKIFGAGLAASLLFYDFRYSRQNRQHLFVQSALGIEAFEEPREAGVGASAPVGGERLKRFEGVRFGFSRVVSRVAQRNISQAVGDRRFAVGIFGFSDVSQAVAEYMDGIVLLESVPREPAVVSCTSDAE